MGYFVTHEMGLAKFYLYTKFDISSFNRSRFTEGGLKFNFWSLDSDHALFGVFRHARDGTCQKRSIIVRDLTFLASPVPDLRMIEGVLKFNFWSLDSDHSLFGVFRHARDGTCPVSYTHLTLPTIYSV